MRITSHRAAVLTTVLHDAVWVYDAVLGARRRSGWASGWSRDVSCPPRASWWPVTSVLMAPGVGDGSVAATSVAPERR